jgi:hypothetical protein
LAFLAILSGGAYLAVDSFFRGWGAKIVFRSAAAPDSSAKATLYQIDAGAAGATRTYVALSNAAVDGSERGNVVLTLLHLEKDAGQVTLTWKTNRVLVITYPASGEIEYAVSKTRGIVIETAAN